MPYYVETGRSRPPNRLTLRTTLLYPNNMEVFGKVWYSTVPTPIWTRGVPWYTIVKNNKFIDQSFFPLRLNWYHWLRLAHWIPSGLKAAVLKHTFSWNMCGAISILFLFYSFIDPELWTCLFVFDHIHIILSQKKYFKILETHHQNKTKNTKLEHFQGNIDMGFPSGSPIYILKE